MSVSLERLCVLFFYCVIFVTFPVALCFCFKIAREYERIVIFRLGRLKEDGSAGPGLIFFVPCIDVCHKTDLRVISFNIPPQEILTKDAVTITVDAVVYYKVSEPLLAINQVEDYSDSTRLLGSTTLRNVLGTRTLAEVLSDRDKMALAMKTILDEATDIWGVSVSRVELTDVVLPQSMQRAMAAEGEATREARANVIAAEGELKSAVLLKEASEVIAENPCAIQLRYLQTLTTISTEKNNTFVFPLPIQLMKKLYE